MAIRFVIGRAGTGKTQHCLQSVRTHLRESPADGERLILLVPEQASLQTERSLLDDPAIGATTRAEVLSFRRLAHRVLQHARTGQPAALSTTGRAMVLRHLLGQLRERLTFYTNTHRTTGFIDHLARTVAELIEEAVSPDDLRIDDAKRPGPAADPLRQHKIADLRTIYAAYLEYLGDDKLDPSQHLELARRQIPTCNWLAGARIWVDGFAGFTAQQKLTLVALAQAAQQVEVTVMIDPDYADQAGDLEQIAPSDLFAKVQRMHVDLHRMLVQASIQVGPPLALRPSPPPRFAQSPTLAHLERSLFDANPTACDGPPALHVIEAANRRVEVNHVVSLVCHLVRQERGTLRYRDIAIILRDLEPYHDLLSAALSERAIPFFMDRRRPTSHHPLIELIRGLVALAATAFSMESVRLLLKNDLLGLDRTDCDTLENYVLAHGITGPDIWHQEQDWAFHSSQQSPDADTETSDRERRRLDHVNHVRRQLLDRISPAYNAAIEPKRRTARDWVQWLLTALQHLDVARHLADWATRAEHDGELDLAEQHRQIVRDASAFLDDICTALGDELMDIAHFGDVLNAGLSQFTLGLAPPMLDQVLVGSVERSRHPEIKVAIVMGFNESLFPHTAAEDAILNDDDRTWLERSGVIIGPTRRQRVLEEPLLVYTALTRASERVFVTCAMADEQGKTLRPSPYLAALQEACPGLRIESVPDPVRARETWPVHTSRELAAHLALEWRTRPPLHLDEPAPRTRWNDLYEASRQATGIGTVLRRALASLAYTNTAALTPESARLLVRDPFRASVSRLETFAACAFKHFAHYALRLERRQLSELANLDVGKLHHAILERFVQRVVDQKRALADLDEAELQAHLQASCTSATEALDSTVAASTARDTYVLRRSADELSRVLNAQKRIAQRGRFRPRGTEVSFGFDETGSLPPLELRTPAGRRLLLRGYIDRIDLAELADEMLGVVIDYKRTRAKRLDLTHVYHGLSLQLLGYLLVLAEQGQTLAGRPIQPVGAFYVSLIDQYNSVSHPDDAKDDRADAAFSPRGILDAARITTLDTDYTGTGRSNIYSIERKKDGELGHPDSTDAAEHDDFDALLKHTQFQLGKLADQIIDGDVRVAPYRLGTFSPCSWCDYRSVCRFEFGPSQTPRYLEKLKRSQVLEKIRAGPKP